MEGRGEESQTEGCKSRQREQTGYNIIDGERKKESVSEGGRKREQEEVVKKKGRKEKEKRREWKTEGGGELETEMNVWKVSR